MHCIAYAILALHILCCARLDYRIQSQVNALFKAARHPAGVFIWVYPFARLAYSALSVPLGWVYGF